MSDVNAIIDDGEKNKTEEIKDDIGKITEGKYKTASDLHKAYKELEKKMGDISEEVRQSREFAKIVQPILSEIQNDPEIFDKIDKKLKDPKTDGKTEDKKDDSKANAEVRDKMSDIIVAGFEDKHNFSDLSKEDQKTLRNAIGNEIMELTGRKLADIDLRAQSNILEKAYKLVKGTIKLSYQDETDDDKNNDGAIGTIKSSREKGDSVLSSEEASVASRLGLTREQYVAGKKK